MKFTYIIMLLVAFSIFSFNSATAEEFGYGRTEELPINYSLIPTVNNSDYLRGLTPQQVADLFTEIDSLSLHLSQDNWFNDSNNWNYWDGDSLEFNESKLATIYYNATQSQAVSGTIDGGTLSDTHHPDGNYDGVTFNFSEQAMAPALDLRMNFTNIESFNSGVMRYKTSSLSGDFPVIQLWDYDSSTWEDYPAVAESENFATIEQPVFDDTDHIGTGANLGVVQMRLYKSSNGNTNNHYYIDWVAISKGYGTPSGEEVDPLFEAWLNNPVFDDNVNGSLVNSTWDLIEGSEINASSKLLTSEIESRTNPLVFDLGEDPIIHSDITVSFSKNPSMATAILSTNALAGFEFDSNANFNNPIYASSTITSQNDIRIDSDTYGLELGEDGEVIFKFDGTDTYFQNQVGTGGFRFGGRIEVSEASTGLPTNQQAIQTDGEVSSDQDYRSMQIGTDITSNITGDHTVQAGWFNVRADPDSDGVTEISAIEIVKAFISGKWTTNADVDKWVSYGTYNNLGSAFAGDINNMIGFEFNSINTADITGDINNIYGVKIDNQTALTNGYGVYVGNISATNPYAIYTNDGVVRFGDRIDATGDANAVFRGYQGADSKGFFIYGYDDRNTDYFTAEVDQYGRGVIRTTKDMLYTAESGLIDFKADYGDVRVRPGYYLAGEQKFYVSNPSTGDAVFSADTIGNTNVSGNLTVWDKVGIGVASPNYPLEIVGSATGDEISLYVEKNISATGFITRTSIFNKNENTEDYIKDSDYFLDDGKINHSKFYGYVNWTIPDKSKPVIEEIEKSFCYLSEEDLVSKDRGELIGEPELICENYIEEVVTYPFNKTEEGVDLGKEIDVLRQAIFEMKEENDLLKSELCKKDNTYPWCLGVEK